MTRETQLGGRIIGDDHPTYVVAELSANHNGSFERAVDLVAAAAEAGADAVKVQTYTADTLTIDSDREYFRVQDGTLWSGQTLYELYSKAYMPWEWQPRLQEEAKQLGLDFLSTPFDRTATDFLNEMDIPAFKIASFEIVDVPLIEYVASKGKPLIISTGMATPEEIREAVDAACRAGAPDVVLLKCTSAYPAPPEEANLRMIPRLRREYERPVGLSDHTLGISVPVAAVALGARVVEKHFTLSRSEPGPDSAFSLEPQEFAEMVAAVRVCEKALGSEKFALGEKERRSHKFRRSLFVVEPVREGESFTERSVRSIRPGHGLPPKYLSDIVGRRAARDVERGTPLDWNLVLSERDET